MVNPMIDIRFLSGLTLAVLVLAKYALSRKDRTTAQQVTFFSAFVVAMAWLIEIGASA